MIGTINYRGIACGDCFSFKLPPKNIKEKQMTEGNGNEQKKRREGEAEKPRHEFRQKSRRRKTRPSTKSRKCGKLENPMESHHGCTFNKLADFTYAPPVSWVLRCYEVLRYLGRFCLKQLCSMAYSSYKLTQKKSQVPLFYLSSGVGLDSQATVRPLTGSTLQGETSRRRGFNFFLIFSPGLSCLLWVSTIKKALLQIFFFEATCGLSEGRSGFSKFPSLITFHWRVWVFW